MKIIEYINIYLFSFIFLFILPTNALAQTQTIDNCSINIYPQPTIGTHRYTVTITNNTSAPGYYFINNYFVDGNSGGNPSNVATPSYFNYWFIQNGLGYQIDGWAGIPINNSSISYDIDLTFNHSFDGIDFALRGNNSTTNDICSQGHGTYTITYNDLSGDPIPTPPPIMPTPAPIGVPNCGLNIYPQPVPGTYNYTVTLTNNTLKPGYFFVNNYFFDNSRWGQPSNVTTTSDWYIHAPTVLGYMVTGTARTPIAANGSINYTTDLTFSNSFDGVDLSLSTYNTYMSNNINDVCNQQHGTYVITYDDPNTSSTPLPTPRPVLKTFFVPGFGASWNAEAFANCSFDNNPDHWSLASYAEDVYKPILTALSDSDWDTIPFYYDWRQQIRFNSATLSDKINSSTVSDEKVNIVGHSMGGLVASDYLANRDQGAKTNSLLAVGSPLKGAVQAYPAWAGGDIWEDNFVTKVAMTLYLKHCNLLLSSREAIHQFVPSVQNLLPTFDYLRDAKTGIPKSTSLLLSQNNWLPLYFTKDFWGVKFGTLTGTGQNTLSEILTKGKIKKDYLANWSDGKPEGGIYSNEGDGTVLLLSSKVDSGQNITINETHSGLVNSTLGMSKILEFLDSSPSASFNPVNTPVNSALVIISYPANFVATDQNGKTKPDKNGMVSFVNPKSGSYKLNLLPKTNNTLLVVAQFLPNGDVKYKEYNLTGLGPKFKTLKFDLQNPAENILN